jgi:uncharacterized protein YoxC
MKKNEFRAPLIQSAAVLCGVLVLFAIVASSGASSSGGGVLAIIFGIGNIILFFIGMGLALLFSIGLLIAIFLAAVAMVDPGQASQMYSDLKKNFALNAISLSKQCCGENISGTAITDEEYELTKQEIALLHKKNVALQGNIKGLTVDNALLQGKVNNLSVDNSVFKGKIKELNSAVDNLQNSESEIKDLVANLTASIQSGSDQDLKNQIKKLVQLHADTHIEIETLMERLKNIESTLNPPPTSGILTYIIKEEDQALFIQKVEEALAQEMTYAQIDDYLTNNLPPELDKNIKEHPALTKNYIRSLRRD